MHTPQPISYPADGNAACLEVEDRSFWFRHRNECISALVAAWPCEGRLVDVGGGNGFVARRLADDGLDVTLVEPGADGARTARDLRRIAQVIQAPLAEATAQLGPVGAIGAFDVVEHIADDRAFVGQVADVLGEGGMFYSTVPAHAWLWSGADDAAGHFRRYTLDSYRALLAERFELVYASYFFGALVLPAALMRALPYRLGRRAPPSADEAAREHGTSGGMLTRLLAGALRHEVKRIAAREPMSWGSSLIVAARKRA